MFDASQTQTLDVPQTDDGLDGRRTAARRTRELVATYTAALGGSLDPLQREGVQRCAELTATAEEQRKRALRGEPSARRTRRLDQRCGWRDLVCVRS
jgi:hypothetical protein